MATIEYQWHDHPLQLRSVLTDAKAQCLVCLQPLSGYNYRCLKCNSFLHISCLKLPLESTHPLHQNHPLTLLPQPPQHHQDGSQITCSDCNLPCSGFTYHCKACPYTLHLHCASQQRDFKFEIHKHPLTFLSSPPSGFDSFRCYVCGDLGSGFNLSCKECEFVVHIECSALPVTMKREKDANPFVLTTTRSIDDDPEEVYCDVCEELVNPNGCIYYLKERVYIAHLGCLISAPKPHFVSAYKNSDNPDFETDQTASNHQFKHQWGPIGDPDSDNELTKLRTRFSEQQIGDKAESSQSSSELKVFEHFTHQHSLALNDDHEQDKYICYGCWGKISGVAYSCNECKFYLHRWCAELPRKIQHPIHSQHSLTLFSSPPRNLSQCDACDEPCDGFTYSCEKCHFNLHSMCASIPTKLRNEIHNHPLFLHRKRPYSIKCKACGNDCTGTVFLCEICNLELDFKCALLPFKVRHRCHVDPLILTYVPFDEDWDEYYCDACEKERDPKKWVYHCVDCEYSAHMDCVVSEFLGGLPSKGLLEYDHYEHLLSLITRSHSEEPS